MNESPYTPDETWPTTLIRWYQKNARHLPWREKNGQGRVDPYHVLVSELMLQQTRIETVREYYARFMADYPTVHELSMASEEDVLKHWEGLGYYTRARSLHKAARAIDQAGAFPSSFDQIRRLQGVGDYTAGAIASIAFGQKIPAVDGNVMRVMSRLYALEENVLETKARQNVTRQLKDVYPAQEDPADFTQALMELGEIICLPKAPLCESCPLKESCMALAQGRQDSLPVRVLRTARKEERLLVLLCRQPSTGRLLLAQRPQKTVLAGLWELPNIPYEAGRSDEANVRAFQDKYGVSVRLLEPLGTVKHAFTHITWIMQARSASLVEENRPEAAENGKDRPRLLLAGDKELSEQIMLPGAFRKVLEKETGQVTGEAFGL